MIFEGQGLHTGARGRVSIECRDGPFVLEKDGVRMGRSDFVVVDTTRSTAIADPSRTVRVATVEHLFAALAGLGIHGGVSVVVEGPELPLLDGASASWCRALAGARAARDVALLEVALRGEIAIGSSSYAFAPSAATVVEVEVDFADARLAPRASWSGDADDFAQRIASARTFGFEHEVEALLERGLASHVSPEAVVVVGRDRIFSSGAPFTADEPARHKLLDLLGDLWVHGGPPRGCVRAVRPGHAATHAAVAEAMARGILRASRDAPAIQRLSRT
ncbi:MAG: UDP-3-O-acyl-N-acetylglucosamine deacetylase [Deltaproteobacteria bacterium]|nr:UDP-3-O-acyl-N-acetylglucosamine deacetylase [Deltaproteobacteria bacterium]